MFLVLNTSCKLWSINYRLIFDTRDFLKQKNNSNKYNNLVQCHICKFIRETKFEFSVENLKKITVNFQITF